MIDLDNFDPEEYKGFLKIDRDDLDAHVSEQPVLYNIVAEALALAMSRRDECKEKLKQCDAEIDLQIRSKLYEAGEKITEHKIENIILSDEKHVEAVGVHLDSIELVYRLEALKESFGQRSFMLRELVQLYLSGYYNPSESVQTRGSRADDLREKRLSEELRKKREKKREEK